MNLKKETNLQTKLQNSEVDNQLEELLTEIPEAFGQEGDEALTLVNYISEESVELIHATIARPLCGCERFLAQTNKLFPSLNTVVILYSF